MVNKEDLNASVFINPRTDHAPPPPEGGVDTEAHWVQAHSDYVWLGKGKTVTRMAPETVIAHEKLNENPEGVNLLFGDGHVEFMPTREAQRAIDRSKAGPKVDGNP
jgi:prepilin-type processing-associated H-X9-DG protein